MNPSAPIPVWRLQIARVRSGKRRGRLRSDATIKSLPSPWNLVTLIPLLLIAMINPQKSDGASVKRECQSVKPNSGDASPIKRDTSLPLDLYLLDNLKVLESLRISTH